MRRRRPIKTHTDKDIHRSYEVTQTRSLSFRNTEITSDSINSLPKSPTSYKITSDVATNIATKGKARVIRCLAFAIRSTKSVYGGVMDAARDAFKQCDSNGDGTVTLKEASASLI